MASDISLTAGMRNNLLSLQNTVALLDRTQDRLASGKKVNTALDDPGAYFKSKALNDRAGDIGLYKDNMGQAIQTVQAADKGIKAITALVQASKALAEQAKMADAAGDTDSVSTYITQINDMNDQINNIVAASGYQGINLLNKNGVTIGGTATAATSSLDVAFEAGSLLIKAIGVDSGATGLSLVSLDVASTELGSDIQDAISALGAALTKLRTEAETLAASLSIVQIQINFTTDMQNVLTIGADKLVLADMNEEGANMLMLQTRQALSTTALSLSAQAAQSVLRLFG